MDGETSSIDKGVIHGTLSSIDEICSSMDVIVLLSDYAHVLQSFGALLAKICNPCEKNVMDDNFIHG